VHKSINGLQMNEYSTKPDSLGCIGRKMLDPTFQPSITPSKNATKKRERITDPAYRANHTSSSENDNAFLLRENGVTTSKKRKRITNPTYRGTPALPGTLIERPHANGPPRKRSRKRSGALCSKRPRTPKAAASNSNTEVHQLGDVMAEIQQGVPTGGGEIIWERDWCVIM
jgi:hypothetical protein